MPNEKFAPRLDVADIEELASEVETPAEVEAVTPARRRLGTGAAGCPEHPKLGAEELKDHNCEAH